ncbi:MAG: hypothetical protein H6670_11040 [Anaerolineaceae bacterium]|nr:hypothetical protein [Anaerolineaceae bacterium]
MNLTEFQHLYDGLATAALDDPVLHLAYTVAWLDPLRVCPDDPVDDYDLSEDYYYGEGDDLEAALHITRGCFPDLYAEAVADLHTGVAERQVEEHIRDGICEQGIPMDIVEFEGAYAFGIPMPACGIDAADPDTLEPFQGQIETLYDLFGIDIDWDTHCVHIPDNAHDVALAVALSLNEALREQYPVYDQLYWLLGWAFSMTGNSSVDCTWEILAEFQPLDWSPDNVAFTRLIVEECDQIMTAATAGLDDLQDNEALRETLTHNIAIICKKLKKKGRRDHDRISEDNPNPFGLDWPQPASGSDRTAELAA